MDRYRLIHADARAGLAQLKAEGVKVHCIVTSSPYWALRAYHTVPQLWGGKPDCEHSWTSAGKPRTKLKFGGKDDKKTYGVAAEEGDTCEKCGAWRGELGQEPEPELYISHLAEVFDACWDVLRDDGILWVNIADSYANSNGTGGAPGDIQYNNEGTRDLDQRHRIPSNYKENDRVGIPLMLAEALRRRGWYWRSDSLWIKSVSFCPTYVGSCMPESVQGWQWVPHRIKIKGAQRGTENYRDGATPERPQADHDGKDFAQAQTKPCPGCEKCTPNDGLVLKRGSWRPTRAHEYILMFTKTKNYFADADAVREVCVDYEEKRRDREIKDGHIASYKPKDAGEPHEISASSSLRTNHRGSNAGRNLRTAWVIPTECLDKKYKHFATFPKKLVEPIVKVSTSEYGCCSKCGTPYVRIVERGDDDEEAMAYAGADSNGEYHGAAKKDYAGTGAQDPSATKARILAGMKRRITRGWKAVCSCEGSTAVPCTVLDPFSGTGTSVMVAIGHNRYAIGIELSEEYIAISKERILEEQPMARTATLDNYDS